MKTYGDIFEILKTNANVYVAVFYAKGTMEWYKIDKQNYIDGLEGSNMDHPYPCYVEVECDGEVFIHPKIENN